MTQVYRKQILADDVILEQIARVTRTTVSADDIAVFEAAAASTRPMSKFGSLYHGGMMTRTMLAAMADQLNSGQKSVPLHTLHQSGSELPIGRVFAARLQDEVDGTTTLITTFFIGKSHKEMIEAINLGVIDEVSVGVMPHSATCSKCGFDFFSAEADVGNLFMQTCENGHTVGEDGMHLRLEALADWYELSLVSRGAADKPKILSRAKSLVPTETYDRMAASGRPAEAVMLFATHNMEIPMTTPAPPTETTQDPAATFDAEAAFNELTATVAALTAQIAALVPAPAPEPQVEPAPATADHEALSAQLSELSTRLETLEAKNSTPAEPTKATELPTGVPLGGLAAGAVTDTRKQAVAPVSGVFKSKRA